MSLFAQAVVEHAGERLHALIIGGYVHPILPGEYPTVPPLPDMIIPLGDVRVIEQTPPRATRSPMTRAEVVRTDFGFEYRFEWREPGGRVHAVCVTVPRGTPGPAWDAGYVAGRLDLYLRSGRVP